MGTPRRLDAGGRIQGIPTGSVLAEMQVCVPFAKMQKTHGNCHVPLDLQFPTQSALPSF